MFLRDRLPDPHRPLPYPHRLTPPAAASAWIVYTIRYKDPFRSTYEAVQDTFKYIEYAIAPSAVLALVFNEGHWAKQSLWHFAFEIAWAFSIWLEAIAIVPQLILLQRHRSVENITSW